MFSHVCDLLPGPYQESKAVNRKFSCSPARVICFTSKLWMRPEPVNRVRLLSFPPRVKHTHTLSLCSSVHLLYDTNTNMLQLLFSGFPLIPGTRFHLLKASAHPALELSADHTTVHFSQEAADNTAAPQWVYVSSYHTLGPLLKGTWNEKPNKCTTLRQQYISSPDSSTKKSKKQA